MSDDRFERLCALAATLGMDLKTARWATKDERGSSYIIKDAEGNVYAFDTPDLELIEQWFARHGGSSNEQPS
jgi:predicted transcriptional regulator